MFSVLLPVNTDALLGAMNGCVHHLHVGSSGVVGSVGFGAVRYTGSGSEPSLRRGRVRGNRCVLRRMRTFEWNSFPALRQLGSGSILRNVPVGKRALNRANATP